MSPEATKAMQAKARAAADAPATVTPGQRAYRDYFAKRAGLNSEGGALPTWCQLPAEIRAWWEHAGVQPPGAPAWYASKVFWFNALVLGAAAAEANYGVLQGVLPGNVFAWVAFGLPLLNKAVQAYQLFKARP